MAGSPRGAQLERWFRGERSSRIPAKVFWEGLPPKGKNMDLEAHIAANLKDSGFVATSSRSSYCKGICRQNG